MRFRLMLCCLLLCIAGAAGAMSITVDASKPGAKFAPTMYGLFFEEINHSGDSGLYAEMVRNRSFEDYKPVEGSFPRADGIWWKIPNAWRVKPDISNDSHVAWYLANSGGSNAAIELDKQTGINKINGSSLKLKINSVSGDGAGIANEGYWGMSVKTGETYKLSFYVKSQEPYRGKLTAFLEDSAGKPISNKVTVSGVAASWKQFKASLKGTGTDPKSRLVILADAPGTLWFDMVSLFPKTFKNRPNGFRQDITQMLADLKPGFMRWPGGCIVEGLCLANSFNWKDTVGPIEERPGKWNLWGYRRTDGFGYLEFLQLCEDFKCEPLLVVNCGISCQWRAPQFAALNRMDPFVQDALDAIEYANGPVTSKWGALRARDGHPEPFHLKYLEIGNENWGNEYAERYNIVYSAVKKAYPDIITISDNILPGMKMEINDEHYYNKPEFFQANFNKYDSYDRKAHKVFVGEVACTEGSGKTGNLRAALGEGAFLLGAERNPDIVQLVSYAPLLVNTNDRVWSPDQITFDTSRAFGNPSYYLYKMLGTNLPSVALPVTCDAQPIDPTFPGMIGVGTIAETTAEFKDIKVEKEGKTLFSQPDFSAGTGGWDLSGTGKWDVVDGCLRQEKDGKALAGDLHWEDYSLTLKARKISGNEGFVIYFSSGPQGDCRWNIGGWGNTQHSLDVFGVEGAQKPGKIENGKWYDVKVELKGASIKCYLDGQLIHEATRPVTSIFASAGKDNKSGEIIIKVSNPTKSPYNMDVKINGVAKIAPKGTEIVLSNPDPWAENSFEEPTKVSPVTREIDGLAQSFKYTFQPYSFTILRLKTK